MFTIGSKINVNYNGLQFPGIVQSEPEAGTVVTSRGVTIQTSFVEVLTLREPNPDGPNAQNPAYLRVSKENAAFLTGRYTSAIGLDVDENNVPMTPEALETARGVDIQRRGAARIAAAAPVTV